MLRTIIVNLWTSCISFSIENRSLGFYTKIFSKNFANFSGEHSWWSLLETSKVTSNAPLGIFSYVTNDIFQIYYFSHHLWEFVSDQCTIKKAFNFKYNFWSMSQNKTLYKLSYDKIIHARNSSTVRNDFFHMSFL